MTSNWIPCVIRCAQSQISGKKNGFAFTTQVSLRVLRSRDSRSRLQVEPFLLVLARLLANNISHIAEDTA
jgi:hypothetical protein